VEFESHTGKGMKITFHFLTYRAASQKVESDFHSFSCV
jgi:hypothetical protein